MYFEGPAGSVANSLKYQVPERDHFQEYHLIGLMFLNDFQPAEIAGKSESLIMSVDRCRCWSYFPLSRMSSEAVTKMADYFALKWTCEFDW